MDFYNKKGDGYRKQHPSPEYAFSEELALDSTNRASASASATAHAGVLVDLVVRIALRNCTGGASIDTGAARNASIGNLVSHSRTPCLRA